MSYKYSSITSPTNAGKTKMLLPVVQRMVLQLDGLFVEFVGPVAPELVGDVFAEWLVSGKTGPSGLLRYIQSLAQILDNPAEQVRFTARAREILSRL